MATLKQALSEAKDKAAKEHTKREKQEARVGEVQQELQALMTKHEALRTMVLRIPRTAIAGHVATNISAALTAIIMRI